MWCWTMNVINAKKHSLSHQLTAQLHIENSKNKKMVIYTVAAYRQNDDCCKSFITIFLFLLFSMCNCAVNWCDKLCFCIYICCFIANFCNMTRWGSKQSHSHRAYIVIFSFLFMWPLKPNHELIPILTFRVTQYHDLDHSRSRDVIVHVTLIPTSHFL